MLTHNEFIKGITYLGITKGDNVLVHSSYKSLGSVEGGPRTIIDWLYEYLYPGTLSFPTFNFSGGVGSEMGVLSKISEKDVRFVRVDHPIFSFSTTLTEFIGNKDAHSEDSFLHWLRINNGKVLIIGLEYQRSFTHFHYIERLLGATYRYNKILPDGSSFFARKIGVETNVTRMGQLFDFQNVAISTKLGGAAVRCVDINRAFNYVKEYFDSTDNTDPHNLLHDEVAIYDFCKEIFNLPRSLTGEANRTTLKKIKHYVSEVEIKEVPSGTKCFDWEVPKEWKVNRAFILDPNGNKICNFEDNYLHLVSYSRPFRGLLSLDELKERLFYREDLPEAIPYVTSYYKDTWGFCISCNQYKELVEGNYTIVVDTELFDGSMTYGEAYFRGKSSKEVLFTTNICHPNLANNETSGIAVLTWLMDYVAQKNRNHRYSYRFLFIPETIGSVYWLSKNLKAAKENIVAGLVVSCVGDNGKFSVIYNQGEKGLSELALGGEGYEYYNFDERGSDERQFWWPNVNLPVCGFTRSKYNEYPEYHTSLDNLDLIDNESLINSVAKLQEFIETLENNRTYIVNTTCEPRLSNYDLYPSIGAKYTKPKVDVLDLLILMDGNTALLNICDRLGVKLLEIKTLVDDLVAKKLIVEVY